MSDKLGPAGKYPQGSLGPHDDGELQFGVARDASGNVHVNFGTPVSWFALPPEQAIQLARRLRKEADDAVMVDRAAFASIFANILERGDDRP